MFARDGAAVRVARAAIPDAGGDASRWRSTVAARTGTWMVRTWTRVPASLSRPLGVPDYVHEVAETGGRLVASQVHPKPRG